ncbi:hypothetical protein C4566_03060 [Candidatus Parcubacteria bacterium]|nr:MAG: hypothetical protein C4566_03060 [Candidatus Parcubacteria bacterium]
MGEGNFEFNAEKIYTNKEDALADFLGQTGEDFFAEIEKTLGARAHRKSFFLNESMHRLPAGVDFNKTYKVGDQEFSVSDLLAYLFEQHDKEQD